MLASYFRTSGAEVIIPTNAASTTSTPGAAAWGAWAQMIAATASEYVLCGASIAARLAGGLSGQPGFGVQFEVGVGAAGAETPVAHGFIGWGGLLLIVGEADTVFMNVCEYSPLKPVRIPAGSRIALRSAQVSGSVAVGALAAYLTGYTSFDPPHPYIPSPSYLYPKGLYGFRSRVYPDAAALATAQNVWVQFINPTPGPSLIRGLASTTAAMGAVGYDAQFDIGVGAPGAEQVVGRVGICRPTLGPFGGVSYLPRPYLVKSGEQVSVRSIRTGTNNTCLLVEELF